MPSYEIRYLTAGDRISLIYKTYLAHDRDAVLKAVASKADYKSYEIWRGDEFVERGINPRVPN
jgi:hypothetical protein